MIILQPGETRQVNATLVRLITIEDFHFTEVVENHLPEYAVGWAANYCPDRADAPAEWRYRPPDGYEVAECVMNAPLGSHGGCPGCAMCQVKCVKI